MSASNATSNTASKRRLFLKSMIDQGSTDPFVWYAYAMAWRSEGSLQEALNAYDRVATQFPDYVPTYLMAGQVAEELEHIAEARAWFERGINAAKKAGDTHALSELEAALGACSA